MKSMTTKDVVTENGMPTNSTTSDALVDLFSVIGALRNAETSRIENLFSAAYKADPDIAMRMLFWARDIREGQGERKIFRLICVWLAKNHPTSLLKNLKYIPEFGRYDDLLYIYENTNHSNLKKEILKLIGTALNAGDALCAKWMPRKGFLAKQLRDAFGLSPKKYRNLLVSLTKVVETPMCANDWDSINFNHVPSVAMSRYKKAFSKNSTIFSQWISDLVAGKKGVKVNAGAIYPYEIIRSLRGTPISSDAVKLSNQQWKSLPNWVPDTNLRIMPVVDTSGSMGCIAVSGNIYPIDVAVSLGIYLSERNKGPYQDYFITFSDNPQLQQLTGSLRDRMKQLMKADWGGSTNIVGVFDLILKKAVSSSVPEEDMPTHIIIFSDMEFDQCSGSYKSLSAMEIIKKKYQNAGYKLPKIIFWNIQSRQKNYAVKFDEAGTALVSGFSPSIIKHIEDFLSPMHALLRVVNAPRYAEIYS